MRFVGQRSRSKLLKIEQKLDTFFVSARYLKNEMSDLSESWFSRVATKSNSAYNMMNGVRASGRAIISAQYLKNEMSDLNETWYTHAWW